jgi:AraC-like DNA-binding protein/mannose-6-phosphate isomerase-like protein (cupin superfamily)
MDNGGQHRHAEWEELLGTRLPSLVSHAEGGRFRLLSAPVPSTEKLYVHAHPEICFLLEGALTVETAAAPVPLEAGAVLVVAPGTYHFPRSRGHSAVTVWFAGARDHMAGILSRTFREGHWISLGGFDLLEFSEGGALLREVVQELSGTEPGSETMARALVTRLCVRALRALLAADDRPGEREPESRTGEILREAKRFIRGNYIRPLTLTDVAHHVALSPNYLANVFSRELGKTVRQYLSEVRMEEAKRLLSKTARSVSEIAYEVGYHSPFYFSRAFKAAERISPSEYRETHHERTPPPNES